MYTLKFREDCVIPNWKRNWGRFDKKRLNLFNCFYELFSNLKFKTKEELIFALEAFNAEHTAIEEVIIEAEKNKDMQHTLAQVVNHLICVAKGESTKPLRDDQPLSYVYIDSLIISSEELFMKSALAEHPELSDLVYIKTGDFPGYFAAASIVNK